MNYNFNLKWEAECLPLVKTDKFKKIIRNSINKYIKNNKKTFILENLSQEDKLLEFTDKKIFKLLLKKRESEFSEITKLKFSRYKSKRFPLEYAVGDCFDVTDDNLEETVSVDLIQRGILKDYDGDYDDDDAYMKYIEYRSNIINPYIVSNREKNYRYYCLYNGCHWYNNTFGLELAKMVLPHIQWKILISDLHTTVCSIDEKLVFDILYFDERDKETLGGLSAITQAKCKINKKVT